jgi:TusA-related sulfurtransferase
MVKARRAPVSAEVANDRVLMELDLRGSVCPSPTGDTLAALKKLSAGDKLIVITDYLPARQTIPRLVEQRGCSWQITEDDGKTFRLEIVKGE